ncbi:MAG: hypothetical protein HQL47_11185 [Gammaproteobacteria bacterium]|nr:hypothetical protein [Gammaproteobacteria bacterium]
MHYRAILYHKQSTSARLRFLHFAYHSVCAFAPLPSLAQVHPGRGERLVMHPAQVLWQLQRDYGFAKGDLRIEEGYRFRVEVPCEQIEIFLVAIQTLDPPFDQAEAIGARFIDLTQARSLPAVELELLRAAYEWVMEG